MIQQIKNIVKYILGRPSSASSTYVKSSEYWTEYNITNHRYFESKEKSLEFLQWRFDQYLGYEKLMPCSGWDDKVILDYGCGPGHDVIGFIEQSKPSKVIAMDVSKTSLKETEKRLELHHALANVELKLIDENGIIPLEDNSVDYIHSSGVLHHIVPETMHQILKEFNRVLKKDGIIRIMVYNTESIWNHLYVAYNMLLNGEKFKGFTQKEAFTKSTDGENCPISRSYVPKEFIDLCSSFGFKTTYNGAAICVTEMQVLSKRFDAIQNIYFADESRRFLMDLTFNEKGLPCFNNQVAGLDAVFELTKK